MFTYSIVNLVLTQTSEQYLEELLINNSKYYFIIC